MLSKAVSHWVRIWLSFHVVTVQVPCTARSRWLSSAQWLIPGHDLLNGDHSQPGVFTQKLGNFQPFQKVYWNLSETGALSFWRTPGILVLIIKVLSLTAESQWSVFLESVPSTELHTTPAAGMRVLSLNLLAHRARRYSEVQSCRFTFENITLDLPAVRFWSQSWNLRCRSFLWSITSPSINRFFVCLF